VSSKINTIENDLNDEISLLDVYLFFKAHYPLILKICFCFMFTGLFYAFINNPRYQAEANIQMAMVANNAVESPATLVEKLKMPTYYSNKTLTLCDFDLSETAGEDLVKSLKPNLNRNAPIVSLSHQSKKIHQGQQCIEAVLIDIRRAQNILAIPAINSRKELIKTLKQKLEAAELINKQLSAKNYDLNFNDAKFSASALIYATTLSKETEIKDLNQQIYDLEQSLIFPQTTETYLASPIHIKKISNRLLTILISIFIGLMFGIGVALIKTNIKSTQKKLANL